MHQLPTLPITCSQGSTANPASGIAANSTTSSQAVTTIPNLPTATTSLLPSPLTPLGSLPPLSHNATPSGVHISSPSSDTSSNSSVYDATLLSTSLNAAMNMSDTMITKCCHAKRILILTSGEVTPKVMCQWELACLNFFSANKKITDAKCIESILPGLQDLWARDWVATNCTQLVALTFKEFMKELKMEFLPENWDHDLYNWICSSHLKICDNFAAWLNEIRHMNIILCGTDYHLDDDALRRQLDGLLNNDLQM